MVFYLIMHIQNMSNLIKIWVIYIISQKILYVYFIPEAFLLFDILLWPVITNYLYIFWCLDEFGLFLFRAIGEECGSLTTKKNYAEILQAIWGFFSLLICFIQILNNETFIRSVLPNSPTNLAN